MSPVHNEYFYYFTQGLSFGDFTQGLSFGQTEGKSSIFRKSTLKGFYKCPQCGRSFTAKASLKRHMVLHSGNFKWYCEICKKGYSQKENYEQHIRAHKGLKYRCELCGKGFSTENLRKYHMSEHTGVYNYNCENCGKGFNPKPEYLKHLNTCGELI